MTNYFKLTEDRGYIDPDVYKYLKKHGNIDAFKKRAELKIERYIDKRGSITGWNDDGLQVSADLLTAVKITIANLLNEMVYSQRDSTIESIGKGDRSVSYGKKGLTHPYAPLDDHITIDEDKITYYG